MKIIMGADKAAYDLKERLKKHISTKDIEIEDVGVGKDEDVHYPLIAEKVAQPIANGEYERGILICGTGIGMSIVANKFPGVRAALCHDPYSAERARKSNNAQIITMGARVIGPVLAEKIIDAWLESDFAGENSRSAPKVKLIEEIDERNIKR